MVCLKINKYGIYQSRQCEEIMEYINNLTIICTFVHIIYKSNN